MPHYNPILYSVSNVGDVKKTIIGLNSHVNTTKKSEVLEKVSVALTEKEYFHSPLGGMPVHCRDIPRNKLLVPIQTPE